VELCCITFRWWKLFASFPLSGDIEGWHGETGQ
jgi:hypothetical protein